MINQDDISQLQGLYQLAKEKKHEAFVTEKDNLEFAYGFASGYYSAFQIILEILNQDNDIDFDI